MGSVSSLLIQLMIFGSVRDREISEETDRKEGYRECATEIGRTHSERDADRCGKKLGGHTQRR